MEPKPYWKSKTLLLNALAAISLLVPGVAEWYAENSQMAVLGLTVLNVVLRLVTKDKLGLVD